MSNIPLIIKYRHTFTVYEMIVTVTLKSDSHNRHITPNRRNPKHFIPSSRLHIDHLTSNQAKLAM